MIRYIYSVPFFKSSMYFFSIHILSSFFFLWHTIPIFRTDKEMWKFSDIEREKKDTPGFVKNKMTSGCDGNKNHRSCTEQVLPEKKKKREQESTRYSIHVNVVSAKKEASTIFSCILARSGSSWKLRHYFVDEKQKKKKKNWWERKKKWLPRGLWEQRVDGSVRDCHENKSEQTRPTHIHTYIYSTDERPPTSREKK